MKISILTFQNSIFKQLPPKILLENGRFFLLLCNLSIIAEIQTNCKIIRVPSPT